MKKSQSLDNINFIQRGLTHPVLYKAVRGLSTLIRDWANFEALVHLVFAAAPAAQPPGVPAESLVCSGAHDPRGY